MAEMMEHLWCWLLHLLWSLKRGRWFLLFGAFVWAQEGYRCAQLALFFFLLLLEGAELHEGYFDEKPLIFRRFVVYVGFGEHLQASEKSL